MNPSHDPSATKEFVDQLLNVVPEVRGIVEEHVQFNEELLPYVVFGDITRWIINLYRASRDESGSHSEESGILERTLTFLEDAYASSSTDPEVRNLIGVSFLEELHQAGADYAGLKAVLGPHLRHELERWE